MNYILYDYNNDIDFFTEAVPEPRTVMTLEGETGPRFKQMLSCCRKCVKKIRPGDTIICWYDFMAVMCWWLCGSKRKQIKIIAVNILLKDKDSLKNKLAKFLYKKALQDENFKATVTAKEYGDYLNQILHINKRFFLIHDVYFGDSAGNNFSKKVVKNTVFCGGSNGRDWGMIIDIAERLPEISFNIVLHQKEKKFCDKKIKEKGIKNVVLQSDLPRKEFSRVLALSELVVMPLKYEAPSGLLVFYEAASYDKLIITTNTVTSREYFANNRGILCERDNINTWVIAIRQYIGDEYRQKKICENMKRFLKQECSVEKYINNLKKVIAY